MILDMSDSLFKTCSYNKQKVAHKLHISGCLTEMVHIGLHCMTLNVDQGELKLLLFD